MARFPVLAEVLNAETIAELLEFAREDLQDLADRADPAYWKTRVDNNDASDCGHETLSGGD